MDYTVSHLYGPTCVYPHIIVHTIKWINPGEHFGKYLAPIMRFSSIVLFTPTLNLSSDNTVIFITLRYPSTHKWYQQLYIWVFPLHQIQKYGGHSVKTFAPLFINFLSFFIHYFFFNCAVKDSLLLISSPNFSITSLIYFHVYLNLLLFCDFYVHIQK